MKRTARRGGWTAGFALVWVVTLGPTPQMATAPSAPAAGAVARPVGTAVALSAVAFPAGARTTAIGSAPGSASRRVQAADPRQPAGGVQAADTQKASGAKAAAGTQKAVHTPAAADSQRAARSQAATDTQPAVGSAQATGNQQGASAAERVRHARENVQTAWWERLVSLLGMVVLLFMAWLMSTDRKRVPWRVIFWGMGLQFAFALFILRTPVGAEIFKVANDVIVALLGFTVDGAKFLFGNLVYNNVPVGLGQPGANTTVTATAHTVAAAGASFAFSTLPTIIFFSSLMTLLYHMGVMQKAVRGMAWVMMRTMKTSGAETLSTAGNIFMGQTEAPLLIKPFIADMTNSELHAVMTGGFATVAGGVMAAYVGMLVGYFPDIAGHLMAASVISAPAALVASKLMFPESEEPVTRDTMHINVPSTHANVIDAAAGGAADGLHLALNVGAMLLAFIALIALINAVIGLAGTWTGLTGLLQHMGWLKAGHKLTMQVIFGWVLSPLAWLMGVPWKDATTVGSLIGIKTAVNEFVAYLQLASDLQAGMHLSPRSIIIATYALCGFANFSSIAIQIGGIGGIAPARRSDLARLGLRAMIAGTIASFLTATIAGMVI